MAEETLQEQSYRRIRQAVAEASTATGDATSQAQTLPGPDRLSAARAAIPSDATGPGFLVGRGARATIDHILDDLTPALTGQNLSGRYYGFVTGSTLPVAEVADNIVTAFDQNVQVHLPGQTIATDVEDAALEMLLGLLDLGGREVWGGRIFTTGATGSNILGLACGREHVVTEAASRRQQEGSERKEVASIGELGILQACVQAGVTDIQVLTSMGHSSLSKAAGIIGLGRASVKELPLSAQEPWRLDLDAVEEQLTRQRETGMVSIIAVSAGEVNTSRFAAAGLADMRRLRELADRHGAWIHVDGAFAIFARTLPQTPEFALLYELAAGIELADSITVDGHKILNVPYDCGMFFTRRASILQDVCRNPNAAYLTATTPGAAGCPAVEIHSPLNIGLENSRRWRALPVYATLLSEGREGVAAMVARMVRLARKVAGFVRASEDYELLPEQGGSHAGEDEDRSTAFVVLFRARDDGLNSVLVQRIQESREWYVSGTKWDGRPACRIAVSSWRVNVDEDAEFVKGWLERLAREHKENGKK